MSFPVSEGNSRDLTDYGKIPIAFLVKSRFRVEPMEGGDFSLIEEEVEPFVKDYDALPGEGPGSWTERWDICDWGIFRAHDGVRLIGGAAAAWRTKNLDMLDSRNDVAVLWDIRVHPAYRRKGVGGELFKHATTWASGRGCSIVVVETQDTNVPACRFYAQRGCELAAVNRHAYPQIAEETQLLWHKRLP